MLRSTLSLGRGIHMKRRDIHEFQQVLDDRGISDEEIPEQEEGLHNALADAQHLKKVWGYIVRNDAWQ